MRRVDRAKLLNFLKDCLKEVNAEYKKSTGIGMLAPMRARKEYRRLLRIVKSNKLEVS